MGGGTVKVDSPKRRGRARGKTDDVNILINSHLTNIFYVNFFFVDRINYFL